MAKKAKDDVKNYIQCPECESYIHLKNLKGKKRMFNRYYCPNQDCEARLNTEEVEKALEGFDSGDN